MEFNVINMRVKVKFQKDLVASRFRKSWVTIPSSCKTIEDLARHIQELFMVGDLQLFIGDFLLPKGAFWRCLVRDYDILEVHSSTSITAETLKQNKVVFTNGDLQLVSKPKLPYIKTPAEEFLEKKSQWKIKPIPPREPF